MTEKNSVGFDVGGGFYEVKCSTRDDISKIRFGFGDKYDEQKWGTICKIPGVSKGRPLTLKGDNQYISFRYSGYKNKLTSYYELRSDGVIVLYKDRHAIDQDNIKMKNPSEDPWTEYLKIYRGEAKKNKEIADKLFSEKIAEQEPYLLDWEKYYLGNEEYFYLRDLAFASRPDLKKEINEFLPENCRPKWIR